MDIQTIEIHGERYVLLPEREYLALKADATGSASTPANANGNVHPRFRDVAPLKLPGTPASEMLMRDRR